MNKEQIQNLAKEFCEDQGIKPELIEGHTFVCVKFLQYAIDQGEVITGEVYDRLDNAYFEKHGIKYEPTVSSAGEEFENGIIAWDSYEWTEEHGTYEAVRCAFIDGFDLGKKSSPASTVIPEISDEEVVNVIKATIPVEMEVIGLMPSQLVTDAIVAITKYVIDNSIDDTIPFIVK